MGSIGRDGNAAERVWRPANVPFHVSEEQRGLVLWGALLGVLSVLLLLGYVWVRLQVTEAGYHLSATRQLVVRLEEEGRDLAVDAAAAVAGGLLEKLAAERLGMRPPQRHEEETLP